MTGLLAEGKGDQACRYRFSRADLPNAAAHPTKMGLNPPADPTKMGLNPGLPGFGHCGPKSGCGSYQYGAKSASDNCGDKSGTCVTLCVHL